VYIYDFRECAKHLHYITLETIYIRLSKSNFEDCYGDVVITRCLGKIAEINEFLYSV